MTVEACAGLVARGDPDRFLATMAAPPADRARLWPLYAFNLELARAPWISRERLIGEMRLQFWADTVGLIAAGAPAPAHEVAGPLAELVRAAALPTEPLAAMVAARRCDLDTDWPHDAPALWAYLEATGGALAGQAARALGADASAADVAVAAGTAAAMANWLVAVPALAARGRRPLPEAPERLAEAALARLARARAMPAARRLPRRTLPAFWAGWQAEALLRLAVREPARVAAGRLARSEFLRRGSLLWRSLAGIW